MSEYCVDDVECLFGDTKIEGFLFEDHIKMLSRFDFVTIAKLLRSYGVWRAEIVGTHMSSVVVIKIGHRSQGKVSVSDFDWIKPAFVDLRIEVQPPEWIKGRKKFEYNVTTKFDRPVERVDIKGVIEYE